MENNNENKVMLKIIPKFNFIYEMGMPTGKKIRSSLIVCLIFVIASIFLFSNKEYLETGNNVLLSNFSIFEILKWIAIIAIIFTLLRAIICTIIQSLSYSHTSYTFYEKYMVYEDNFLNQHKKTIQYENVKEVEIRRSIWDRILGYGVIVIYTNAENNRKNGLVIYSIRNVKEVYDSIEKLVQEAKNSKNLKQDDKNSDLERKYSNEEEFKNSLNQVE